MPELSAPFGKVQLFESNDQFGSSILIIEPGKEITKHYHKRIKEIEVILEGKVVCDNKIQKPGQVNVWAVNQAHSYKNASQAVVKILCITVPPYDPKDVFEIK